MAYAAFFDSADMCETLMGYGHNFSILDALIRVELTELFVECSSILKDPDLVKRLTVPGSDISEADIKKLGDMLEVSNAGRGGGAGGGGGPPPPEQSQVEWIRERGRIDLDGAA
jgi:hypothetical protein